MSIHYKTVFDISQKGFNWWLPAAGVSFLIIGLILAWAGKRKKWARSRRTGYIFVGFASLWTLAVLSTTVREYFTLHNVYKTGQYSVIEGQVENFRPMPYDGHQQECFSVKHLTFCYSDFESTAGFNNTASHGGPIGPGLPVKVAYFGDHILRIEVGQD